MCWAFWFECGNILLGFLVRVWWSERHVAGTRSMKDSLHFTQKEHMRILRDSKATACVNSI